MTIEIGQLYIPLQAYGEDIVKDIDEVDVDGNHLVVKDFRVVSWNPVVKDTKND